MRKLLMVAGFVAAMAAGGASAQGFYMGGGLSQNSWSGYDDETGFQLFGGLDLPRLGEFGTAVEVGYMDAGEFGGTECVTMFGMTSCYDVGSVEVAGLWAAGVADYAINPQLSALGRLGIDFGDDDGLMLGVGLGYELSRQIELRGEYVVRDNVDSLQLNVVFRP